MKYSRLPGVKKGFYRKNTLWLGNDHLLAVESHYYAEDYRRFPYRDIQALVLRRTDRFRNLALVLLLPLLLCAGTAWYFQRQQLAPSALVFAILAALFLLVLLVHLAKGPTCACRLQMPLSITELPSLNRLRPARRALARLKECIDLAQGKMAPEEIPHRPLPRPTPAGSTAAATGNEERAKVSPLPTLLFLAALAGDGLLTGLQLRYDLPAYGLPKILLLAAVLFLAVATLVRYRGVPSAGPLKAMGWTVTLFFAIGSVLAYFFMIFSAVSKLPADTLQNQALLYQTMFALKPTDSPLLSGAMQINAAFSLGAALLGLLLLWQQLRSRGWHAEAASPAPGRTRRP